MTKNATSGQRTRCTTGSMIIPLLVCDRPGIRPNSQAPVVFLPLIRSAIGNCRCGNLSQNRLLGMSDKKGEALAEDLARRSWKYWPVGFGRPRCGGAFPCADGTFTSSAPMSDMGQHRMFGGSSWMSGPGGRADLMGRKADIAAPMSAVGARADSL